MRMKESPEGLTAVSIKPKLPVRGVYVAGSKAARDMPSPPRTPGLGTIHATPGIRKSGTLVDMLSSIMTQLEGPPRLQLIEQLMNEELHEEKSQSETSV